MHQVIVGRAFGVGTTSPAYSGLSQCPSGSSGTDFSATEFLGSHPWSATGTFTKLSVQLKTTPGGGKSRTFVVRINGSDSTLTVTTTNTTLTSDTTHMANVTAGDVVTLKETTSGSPTTSDVSWSVLFTSTTNFASAYGWPASAPTDGISTWQAPFNALGAAPWKTVVTTNASLVAAAGTLIRTDMALDVAPGGGKSWTFVCTTATTIDGAETVQDGSGGTPDTRVTITGAALTGSATYSLTLTAGLILRIRATGSGSPASANASGSVAFSATLAGQSQMCGGIHEAPSSSAVRYAGPEQNLSGAALYWDATEGNRDVIGNATTFTLSGFRVITGPTTPGATKTWTWNLRLNGADPSSGPTVSITGSTLAAVDATDTMSITQTDLWDVQSTPTNTPNGGNLHWAAIQGDVTTVFGNFPALMVGA